MSITSYNITCSNVLCTEFIDAVRKTETGLPGQYIVRKKRKSEFGFVVSLPLFGGQILHYRSIDRRCGTNSIGVVRCLICSIRCDRLARRAWLIAIPFTSDGSLSLFGFRYDIDTILTKYRDINIDIDI